MSNADYTGQQGTTDATSGHNVRQFQIKQALARVRTMVPVKVLAVHGGGLGPPPTVDVQPMVNMTDGLGNATPHGTIYNIPVARNQGGSNAIICDPKVNDVGTLVVADRDISSLKANKGAQSNPGSFRRFDLADGVYHASILSQATPNQVFQFTDDGVTVADMNGNKVALSPTGNTINDKNGNTLSQSASGLDLTTPKANFDTGTVVAKGGDLNLVAGGKGFLGGVPAPGQIIIGQGGGAYSPQSISGDATLSPNGAMTVTGFDGNPLGPLAFLGIGQGLSQQGNALGIDFTGDGSVTDGILTVIATQGVPFGQLATVTGFYVITEYGADPTGRNECSAQIQACCDAAYAGFGVVIVPPGKYLVANTIVLKTRMIGTNSGLTNQGQPCEIITTTNINGPVLQAIAGSPPLSITIEHLSVRGFNRNDAIGACIEIDVSANGVLVIDVTTLNGKYGVECHSADCTLQWVDCANYYQGGIYNGFGATYLKRCSLDMGNSNIGKAGGQITLPVWQANHAYTAGNGYNLGDAVHVGTPGPPGGMILFIVAFGTSAGVAPSTTSYSYGAAGEIIDGTVTWGVDAPFLNTFAGLYIDTGSSQVICEDCDLSGDMYNSVYVAPGGTGGLPGELYFTDCTFSPIYYAFQVNSGSSIHITGGNIRPLVGDAATSCILLQGTFLGEFSIVNSNMILLPGCFGLTVNAPGSNTPADVKMLGCESMGGGTSFNTAANISGFLVVGNTLGGTVGSWISNTTAWSIGNGCTDFVIANNFTGGAAASIGTGCSAGFVSDNPGYNPVGSSSLSPTSSTWTYTAGASRESIHMNSTSTVTSVTINGGSNLIPVALANVSFELGSFDVMAVTYGGTLTATRFIH